MGELGTEHCPPESQSSTSPCFPPILLLEARASGAHFKICENVRNQSEFSSVTNYWSQFQ